MFLFLLQLQFARGRNLAAGRREEKGRASTWNNWLHSSSHIYFIPNNTTKNFKPLWRKRSISSHSIVNCTSPSRCPKCIPRTGKVTKLSSLTNHHSKWAWFPSVLLMDTIVPQHNVQRKQRSWAQQEKIKQCLNGETAPGTSLKVKTKVLHLRKHDFPGLCSTN